MSRKFHHGVRIVWLRSQAWMVALYLGLSWGVAEGEESAAERADAFWKSHVDPLIREHCSECHQPSRTKGGLDLTSLHTMLKGGENGPVVVPGHPGKSPLVRVLDPKSDPHMPPGKRRALTQDESELFKKWIEKIPVIQAGVSETGVTGTDTNAESGLKDSVVKEPTRKPLGWTPPGDLAASSVADRFLQLAWERDGIRAAERVEDWAFARRAYLDLTGRLPSEVELGRYMGEPESSRRSRLVDALLDSPEYGRRMREVFDVVLMGRRGGAFEDRREQNHWYRFLESAFQENRPWNEVVKDCIVARASPEDPNRRGAVYYLYERKGDPQATAEALAPIVYGVQIQCAQCHDHMVAREIKQAHYWGMVAAFNRSKSVDTREGIGVSESAIGGHVSFANLKKESQPALLTFFNGKRVNEKRPEEAEKEEDLATLYRIPPPKDKEKPDQAAEPHYSRRAAFAETATENNPLLARAMVNRVWAMLMGRGIVHPVELMDSKHPPSHPELLDWLSSEFAARKHDVKWLIRTICNTRVYQSDGRVREGVKSTEAMAEAFTAPVPKPFSAEQWYRGLLGSTRNEVDGEGKVGGRNAAEMRKALIGQFPDLFVAEYNASLQQAMFLANGVWLEVLVTPRAGNLAQELVDAKDSGERVKRAFRAVYMREPEAEELKVCGGYLEGRAVEAGVKQLLWALLTSAEFQMNH